MRTVNHFHGATVKQDVAGGLDQASGNHVTVAVDAELNGRGTLLASLAGDGRVTFVAL